jgi:hypothetical protein
MKMITPKPLRCAIYTRKSTEHNLDLAFNSLDAQREACEAYVKSQAHEGWRLLPEHYDDGGLSGASLDRPALQLLLAQVKQGRVDVIVVYKVDRLTRSLADFAKLVEAFDAHEVSFVSVTQSFNTTSSMGRLTLNVLLSFAQFEREVIGVARGGGEPLRHLKVGTVMVREHQGVTHEVIVVPGGFSWKHKTYPSLSAIAKGITGTSWNGPRFFGLRGKTEAEPAVRAVSIAKDMPRLSTRSAVRSMGSLAPAYASDSGVEVVAQGNAAISDAAPELQP